MRPIRAGIAVGGASHDASGAAAVPAACGPAARWAARAARPTSTAGGKARPRRGTAAWPFRRLFARCGPRIRTGSRAGRVNSRGSAIPQTSVPGVGTHDAAGPHAVSRDHPLSVTVLSSARSGDSRPRPRREFPRCAPRRGRFAHEPFAPERPPLRPGQSSRPQVTGRAGGKERPAAPQGEFSAPVTVTPALPPMTAFTELRLAGPDEDPDRPRGARTLPDPGRHAARRAGRPGRPRPRAYRFGKDPRLRARAARPDGGPARRTQAAPRAGPGADPGARQQVSDALAPYAAALGLRLATVVGGLSISRQAAALRARCRGRRRDPGTADRPRRAPGLPPGPRADHGAGRGGPDVRHGVPAAGLGVAGPGARRRPADAVLGHARPQRRPPGPPLSDTTRSSPRSTRRRARSPRWNTTC